MKKSPLLTLGICAALLVTDTAIGQTVKTIYFVRHAEDQLAVFPQGLNGNAYLARASSLCGAARTSVHPVVVNRTSVG